MLVGRGFFHLLSVNFLTQFLGFGAVLVLTAFLTPEQLGLAKVLHSYTAFFILFGTFGFNAAILKICSESGWSNDAKSRLVAGVFPWVLFTSVASYLLMLLIYWLGLVSDEVFSWLYIYCLIIPLASFSNIFISYLQSLKEVKKMAKTQGVVRLTFFVVVLLSTYEFGFDGFIYSTIISYLAGFLAFFSVSNIKGRDLFHKVKESRIFGYAIYTFLGAIISVLSQHADVFILEGINTSHEIIGFYSIAILFVMGATQVTATAQIIATPYFSEKTNDKTWFFSKLLKYQLIMILLSFFVAAGVYGVVYLLVEFFYGDSYKLVIEVLPVLLMKYIAWSSFAITGVALLGVGAFKEGTIMAAFIAPIGAVISYYLGVSYGVFGVAWGQVITAILSLISVTFLAVIILNRKLPHQVTSDN